MALKLSTLIEVKFNFYTIMIIIIISNHENSRSSFASDDGHMRIDPKSTGHFSPSAALGESTPL